MKKNQGSAAEMKKEEPEPRTTTRSSRRLTTSENVSTPTKTRKSTATQKKTESIPPEVAKPSRSTRNTDAAKVQTTTRTPRKSAVAASKKSDVATPKKSTAQKSPPTVVANKTRRASAVKATETVEKTTKSRATPTKSKTDDKDEKVKPSQKTGGVTPSRRSTRLSDKLPDEESEVVKKTTLDTIAEVPATVSKRRSLLNEFEVVSPTKGKKMQEAGSPEKSKTSHVNKLGKRKSPRGAESATEEPESSPPKAKRTAKNKEKDSDSGKSQEVSSPNKTVKNSSPEQKLGKRKSPRSKEAQDDEPSPSKKAAKLKEEKFESMISPKKKKLEASPDQKKSQGSSPEKDTRKSRRQAEACTEEPELSPTKAKRTVKNKEKDSNDDKKPHDVASPNKAGTNTVEQNLAKRKSPRSNTQEGDPSPSKRAAKWKEEKLENMGSPKKKKPSISPEKSARKSPRSNSNSKNKNNTEDEKSEVLLESSPEKKTRSPKQQDSPKSVKKSSVETKSKNDLMASPTKTQKSLTSSDSQEEKQVECSPKKTKLEDESKQPGVTEPDVQEQVSPEEAEPKQDTSEEKEKKSLPLETEHKDDNLNEPDSLNESSNDVENSQELKDVESENTQGKMEECQLDTNQEIPENNEEPSSLGNKTDVNQESKTEVSAGEQIVSEEVVEKVNNDDIKTSNSVEEVESPSKQNYAEQIIENAQNSALETCTAENKSNAEIQERQVEKIKTDLELDSNADTNKTVDSTSHDVNHKEMVMSNDPLETSYKTEEDKTLDSDKTEVKSLDSPKEDKEKPFGTLSQDIPESKATSKTESEEFKEEKQDAPVGGSPQTEETCASVVENEQASNKLLAEPVEKLHQNIPESEETSKTDESEEARNENTEFEVKQEAQTDESSEKDIETCTKSKGDECDKIDDIPASEESIISVEDFMVDSDTDKEEKSKDAAKPENVLCFEEEGNEEKPVNPLHTEKTPLDIKENNLTDDRTELEVSKVELYDENEKLEDEVQQIKHDKDGLKVNEKNSLDVENAKTEKTTLSDELSNTTVSFCSKTEQNVSESLEQDKVKKENCVSEPESPLKNANNHTPPMILTNENCNDSDNSCDSGVEVHKSPIDREDQFENFPMKKINVASQAQEVDTESEQNHVTPAQGKDIPQMELEEIETEEKEGDDTILLSTCDESESGDEESAAESDNERKLVKNKFTDIVDRIEKEVLDNGKEDCKKMEMENLEVGVIKSEEVNEDKVIKTMKMEKQEVMDNSCSKKTKLSEEEEESEVTSVKKPKIEQEIKAFDNEDTLDRLKYRISLCNLPKDATENQIRTAFTTVAVHDIIDTYIFVPNAKKNKSARAIVSFRTEKSLHKAISSYGKIEINGTPIYMLFDNALPFNWNKKPDTNENTSNKETANKNPKKRYIAHISKIPIVANANDILNALAERGISSVSRITLHKPTSPSQHYLKGFVKFSKKKSLLKTLRKADRIRVNGNPIKIVPGDEKSYELLKAKRAHTLPSTSKENSTVQ
ncbi:putative WEB family protein At1g65010, chloroplastic [Cimex lectularius]|uniref:RRM domain-containing protein n=1 Tax=Cimex lectularius TaxID=79782 RepID=A0A8I6TF04_CIMLE|nr:putative WEB family protein At1g65010, chloroplastic [Cimex lectularius]